MELFLFILGILFGFVIGCVIMREHCKKNMANKSIGTIYHDERDNSMYLELDNEEILRQLKNSAVVRIKKYPQK